jgi:diguanylate cyclase (GGDEF)-like protein
MDREVTLPDMKHRSSTVPPRALALSLVALAIPVVATTTFPEWVDRDGALLIWLPALLPAFLLTYHRGRLGASLALAAGMAVLTMTQVVVAILGLGAPEWGALFALVVILLSVCLGAGWLAGLLHQERARAERWALSDVLTGLPNRRYLEMFLDKTWAAASRGRHLSVVFLDIDHFKQVNDQHGHAEGDRVLQALAEVLTDRTRRMDLSGRFGGEEFVSVLVDCDLENAEAFAEFVRMRLSEIDFGWGHVTASAGVCALDEGMDSPSALIAAADAALYSAKGEGRNRVCRAEPTAALGGPSAADRRVSSPGPTAVASGR